LAVMVFQAAFSGMRLPVDAAGLAAALALAGADVAGLADADALAAAGVDAGAAGALLGVAAAGDELGAAAEPQAERSIRHAPSAERRGRRK